MLIKLEETHSYIFFIILLSIAFVSKKNKQIRKAIDFIQNSVATFIFTYGFVCALTVGLYYFIVKLGLIDLNPKNQQTSNDVGLVGVMAMALITVFAFNPTSLIIRGYMQRYDEQWKIYEHHIWYGFPLGIMSLCSVWLLWFELDGEGFPVWAKEYIKIMVQSKIVIMAFYLHCVSLFFSARSLKKKHLESNTNLGAN